MSIETLEAAEQNCRGLLAFIRSKRERLEVTRDISSLALSLVTTYGELLPREHMSLGLWQTPLDTPAMTSEDGSAVVPFVVSTEPHARRNSITEVDLKYKDARGNGVENVARISAGSVKGPDSQELSLEQLRDIKTALSILDSELRANPETVKAFDELIAQGHFPSYGD